MEINDLVRVVTNYDTCADNLDGLEGRVDKINEHGVLVDLAGRVVRFDHDELELVTTAAELPDRCGDCGREPDLGHTSWCGDPFAGITPDPVVW